jgi:hypothetical protein
MRTRRRLTAGIAAAAVLGSLGVAGATPASAKTNNGETKVTMSQSLLDKLSAENVRVEAFAPARAKGTSIIFPAKQKKPRYITHTGGMAVLIADLGTVLLNFKFDLQDETVDVSLQNGTVIKDAFDLRNVKIKKAAVTANLKVTKASAKLLNEATYQTVFKAGMTLGTSRTKF